jgi:hypothetical protein
MRRLVLSLLVLAAVLLTGAAAVAGDKKATSRCPRSDRQPVVSERAAAAKMLVPPGTRAVLLCRYRGVNPTPELAGRLAASRRIKKRATVNLAREFNALRPIPPGSGVTACPADDGSKVIAFFHYAHAPDDPVTLNLRGCRSATNGQIVRSALSDSGDKLLRRIETLTGKSRARGSMHSRTR